MTTRIDGTGVDSIDVEMMNTWFSEEYLRMYNDSCNESTVSVAIRNILDVLKDGLSNNFQHLVHRYVNEAVTPLSPFSISRLNQKCMYLTLALELALDTYLEPLGVL